MIWNRRESYSLKNILFCKKLKKQTLRIHNIENYWPLFDLFGYTSA